MKTLFKKNVPIITAERWKAERDVLRRQLFIATNALKGLHDGCNYLAAGVCMKCGKLVNEIALAAIKEVGK